MRHLLIIILCSGWHITDAQIATKSLELVAISQLKGPDNRRFDLSGIVKVKDEFYVVADKEWNHFIYKIEFYKDGWFALPTHEFKLNEPLGPEGLDHDGETFYLANEDNGKIYSKADNSPLINLKINFAAANEEPSTWGNAGWEGLAVDKESNRLYLTKEREPRYILAVDLQSMEIVDKFDIPQTESNDFADAKLDNGFLYVLERNGNFVTKVDPKSHEVIEKYSYRNTCSYPPPNGKLYEKSKFGMAEALLLTDDEIWLGIDNNGHAVSKYAKETYQINGNKPIIIKFKRPAGF